MRCRLMAAFAVTWFVGASAQGQIFTQDPSLPPTGGIWSAGLGEVGLFEADKIGIADDLIIRQHLHLDPPWPDPPWPVPPWPPWPDPFPPFDVLRTPVGINEADELVQFSTILVAQAQVGEEVFPVSLTGPVEVVVSEKWGVETGQFQTEMVAMSLKGEVPGIGEILIREDLERATRGQIGIEDLGNGNYRMDGFFDVNTEVSIDGGQSWVQSVGSARMNLIPEPATGPSFAIGLLALLAFRRCRGRSKSHST